MRKHWKKYSIITIILLLFVSILLFIKLANNKHTVPKEKIARNGIELGKASTKSLVKDKEFAKYTKKYPALKRSAEYKIVIPGLYGAWSLDKHNKLIFCKTFDVQGIATSDKYLFISAYDDNKTANSVVYVLNKQNGKYIKSLILKGRPHAGGLAFDKKTNSLWVSDDTKKTKIDKKVKARLARIQFTDIEKYNLVLDRKPIRYSQDVYLPNIKRTSAIAFGQNKLWIGFFDPIKKGVIQCYDIFANSKDKIQLGVKSKNIRDASVPESEYSGVPKIQGIAVGKKSVLISTSFGDGNSTLLRYVHDKKNDNLIPTNSVKFPPYLEQIDFDGKNHFYSIFESSAIKYRNNTNYIIDRVVILKIKDIIKYASQE